MPSFTRRTDAVDARVLAAMGAAMRLRLVAARSPARRDLDELATARDGLVKDRVAALNRQKHVRHKLLERQNRHRLAQIDRQIKRVDAEIDRLLAADPELARQAGVLASIPGVGPVTAAGLIAEMPELGALDAKAAASLAGLAPMARESGTWKGRSFIQGGRSRVRRLLYMAAVSAIRCNPDLAAKYQQLVGRGKPPKVALVAVVRKLLLLANALLRQNRLWTPRTPPAPRQPRFQLPPDHPPTARNNLERRPPPAPRNHHLQTWILACVCLLTLAARRLMAVLSAGQSEYDTLSGRMVNAYADALAGRRTIRASGTLEREVERVTEALPALVASGRGILRSMARGAATIASADHGVLIATAMAGVWLLATGDLTAGALLAAVRYAQLAYSNVASVFDNGWFQIAMIRAQAAKVMELLASPPAARPAREARRPSESATSEVTFDGVSVRGDEDQIVHDVNLHIPGGATVAVVGESGVGKTTLGALVGRLLHPDAGEVRIDGASVAAWPTNELDYHVEQLVCWRAVCISAIRRAFGIRRWRSTSSARATRSTSSTSKPPCRRWRRRSTKATWRRCAKAG